MAVYVDVFGVGDKWVMEYMSGQPEPRLGKRMLGITSPIGNVGPENGNCQDKRFITCSIICNLMKQTVGLTASLLIYTGILTSSNEGDSISISAVIYCIFSVSYSSVLLKSFFKIFNPSIHYL
jgi:hypothetical protein